MCFNLTCFDLQLDSRDHNHLYIGTNTGHVAHCLKSGGKPVPQFYVPKRGECKLISGLYSLYTFSKSELDLNLL
jgi:hypothetical protein